MIESRRARVAAWAAVVLVGGFSAACGNAAQTGSSPAATTGVSEAKALVLQEEKEATGPSLAAVSSAASAKGKKIAYISANLSFPFSQELVKGVKDAAQALGMTVDVTDSGGDPSKASQLIDQGIARGANAIILQGSDPQAVSAALQHASSSHVVVVSAAAIQAGPAPGAATSAGLSANASFDYTDAGKRMAHFIVADSGGKANVVFVGSSTFPVSANEINGFNTELQRLCSSCKSKVVGSPISEWQTNLGSQTRTLLNSDPTINYFVPVFDALGLFMKPAIAAANAQSRVKVVSNNASLADLQAIKGGNDPEVADVGGNEQWLGWAAVDQVVRVLSGGSAVADERVPNRTFDKTNLASIDLTQDESHWYGSFDFRGYYRTLWGV